MQSARALATRGANGSLLAWVCRAAATLLVASLAACGGGGSPSGLTVTGLADLEAAKNPKPSTGGTGSTFNGGMVDPGLMMLLVPDGTASTDPRVMGWRDAAIEVGTRLAPVTDTEFTALGDNARRYAGLVLPDDLHSYASDAIVEAVRRYASLGGQVMLTFDFGALTKAASGALVYASPKSRLSDLAGVDYILYDELRDRTTGLGPVTGMRSVLRQLLVPPGKSTAWPPPTTTTTATTGSTTLQADPGAAGNQPARYLPPSIDDPGGVRRFDPQQFQRIPTTSTKERLRRSFRRQVPIDYGGAILAPALADASRPTPATATQAAVALAGDPQQALLAADPAPTADRLEAYSGYLIGPLTYASYVTRGTYAGTTLATSPQFGLVAGVKAFGAGQVLFVNLPLTYLKGRTDALPMHGFLRYFSSQMLKSAWVSPMPDGIAGLTYNWHLDAMEAQDPSLQLEQQGFFGSDKLSSMHMTAGPDTIVPGDGLGWNLNGNPTAQALLRRLAAVGQDVGSHGGWIHDYYGDNANETNQAAFQPYLEWNRQAVDGVLGRPSRSYSAPQGNNPTWAMDWLQAQGVNSAYFVGHTGLGPTRQYRDGVLRDPAMVMFPVTPQGLYATYEEWDYFGVPKADVVAWHHDLVDFALQVDTSRLIYAHPPGALLWPDVLQDLFAYAAGKGTANFRWYTMPVLADHTLRRLDIQWREQILGNGNRRFDATHPTSLARMTWRLPKLRYQRPSIVAGSGSVVDTGSTWTVRATGGTQLAFTAKPA